MNRPRTAIFLLTLLFCPTLFLLLAPLAPALLAQHEDADLAAASPWMVELQEAPAAVVHAAQGNLAGAATSATRAQLTKIQASQQTLLAQLADLNTPLLYSVQRVYNGVAILANDQQRQAIAQLPGVAAVHPLIPKTPQNAASIPYLGIPALWQGGAFGSALDGMRGEGVRVAVIDTGIDYLHRDFGGPGAGYPQNDTTRIGDAPGFPGPRIVGGYDFVGDNYSAAAGQPGYQPIPRPDPDPMDCYGHGTHVAGTLAGSGVTAGGATYGGPYNQTVDFGAFAIGPGVAPRAEVFALKVFGCSGSTVVTELALEWAVDPNGDGDFGDHMDVVNLSLGSPYGAANDTSAAAANNAALAGVLVVASAGNSGDQQLITGSPAVADRAISVAASQHTSDSHAFFSARGPRRGDVALKPDLAAPGVGIYSAGSGTGWQGTTASGTSMAAPHVAGFMALLRQARRDWSVEELKALAMNTAAPLLLPAQGVTPTLDLIVRGGAGRIDPPAAAAVEVIAYAGDGSGRVSLSFGAPVVASIYTATQQLTIDNKSNEDVSLRIGYESQTQTPGVRVRVPAQPLTIAAQSTIQAPITLVVDAASFRRVRSPADNGLNGEAWFAEESGYLTLRPIEQPTQSQSSAQGQTTLRVPLYAAPRPLADMEAATTTLDFSTNLEQVIELAGSGLRGSEPPTDVVSLASVLELRLRSPNTRPAGLDPNAVDLFDHADLKYAGVGVQGVDNASEKLDGAIIYFGIVTWAPWSTPNEIGVNVLIDVNGDGKDDFRLYNLNTNSYGGLGFGPAYASKLQDLQTSESWIEGPLNGVSPNRYDSNLFFNSALVLPVHAADLGLSPERSRLAFRIETSSIDVSGDKVTVIDRTPTLFYDALQPALHFAPPANTAPLWPDDPQTRIEVRLDPAGQASTPAAGVLILHHHNAANAQASLVAVNYRWKANVYLPSIRR